MEVDDAYRSNMQCSSFNGIHSNYGIWSTQLISLLYINVLASSNSDFEQSYRNV